MEPYVVNSTGVLLSSSLGTRLYFLLRGPSMDWTSPETRSLVENTQLGGLKSRKRINVVSDRVALIVSSESLVSVSIRFQ